MSQELHRSSIMLVPTATPNWTGSLLKLKSRKRKKRWEKRGLLGVLIILDIYRRRRIFVV